MRYPLFVRRDLDAFFGLGMNNLVDLIIIATVGRALLQLPDELIFGRILPGAGLSLLGLFREGQFWRANPRLS